MLDGEGHRGKNHLMFCTVLICCMVSADPGRSGPALPGRSAARKNARTGSMLSGDNISLYIYLIDALCEFSKFFCRTPCRGRFRPATRRSNYLCAKGLRRRLGTPEKYFSGELSNWPNPALFKTVAPAKPPLFQGGQVQEKLARPRGTKKAARRRFRRTSCPAGLNRVVLQAASAAFPAQRVLGPCFSTVETASAPNCIPPPPLPAPPPPAGAGGGGGAHAITRVAADPS